MLEDSSSSAVEWEKISFTAKLKFNSLRQWPTQLQFLS